MQYLWKITILGVSQQVFRLVSLDGELPLDSVLNLCNLSFDYDNYPDKALYFAQNEAGKAVFDQLLPPQDDSYHGAVEQSEFWQYSVELDSFVASGAMVKLDLSEQPALKLQHAAQVVPEYLQKVYAEQLAATVDCEPNALVESPKFFYSLHGVVHLVEVMKSSQKLMCFVPATLAGKGLVTDDQQQLSLANLEMQFIEQQEQEDANGEEITLDLRACTGRMRALQTELGSDKVNQVMEQAGATPLKFESK